MLEMFFVFAPNGAIIACAVNAPGAMYDSKIADWGIIFKKLEDVYDRTGDRCVVDLAFAKGIYPFLVKSSQDYLINAEHVEQVAEVRQATSARQTAE